MLGVGVVLITVICSAVICCVARARIEIAFYASVVLVAKHGQFVMTALPGESIAGAMGKVVEGGSSVIRFGTANVSGEKYVIPLR